VSIIVPYGSADDRSSAESALAAHLSEGGLIAYPTETVYGLGGRLRSDALERLADIKGDRPFLLLIRGPHDAAALEWTDAARRLAERFWPGPLTLALDDPTGAFPDRVRGPNGAVAVRVSPHPAIPDLLDVAGGPVTSTSANRPGDAPARTAAAAAALSLAAPLMVLDGGELPPAPPSTIVRCGATVRVLREGVVSRSELEAVVELE
jgi:L-threonylcarbamoyladenylate synthase